MTDSCILIPCYRGGIVDFTYLVDASLYHIFSCHARCRRLDKNLKIVSNIPIWFFFLFCLFLLHKLAAPCIFHKIRYTFGQY